MSVGQSAGRFCLAVDVSASDLISCDCMSFACGGQAHAESKLEGLEDAVRRLKAQNDELTRQNQDLNSWKARLTQENYELQRQVQELDSSNGAMAKARAALQQQLDEAKARLDEESRVSLFAPLTASACIGYSCRHISAFDAILFGPTVLVSSCFYCIARGLVKQSNSTITTITIHFSLFSYFLVFFDCSYFLS